MHDYQAPAGLLKDRNILVTGAGDGIGRVLALSYAQLGASVILLGRTQEKLIQVYDRIEQNGGPKPAILTMDLAHASPDHWLQLGDQIANEFGCLHGLVHNAAVLGDITPLSQYEWGTWDHVMATNLRAVFMLTQTLIPVLRKAEHASVIMTTSSVGRTPRAYWGAYAVSKAGIESMCQMWALEMKAISSIRFNCINPGPVRTMMRRHAYPAENAEQLRRPEEILGLYHYLIGDDSIGVTGQSLDAQPKS